MLKDSILNTDIEGLYVINNTYTVDTTKLKEYSINASDMKLGVTTNSLKLEYSKQYRDSLCLQVYKDIDDSIVIFKFNNIIVFHDSLDFHSCIYCNLKDLKKGKCVLKNILSLLDEITIDVDVKLELLSDLKIVVNSYGKRLLDNGNYVMYLGNDDYIELSTNLSSFKLYKQLEFSIYNSSLWDLGTRYTRDYSNYIGYSLLGCVDTGKLYLLTYANRLIDLGVTIKNLRSELKFKLGKDNNLTDNLGNNYGSIDSLDVVKPILVRDGISLSNGIDTYNINYLSMSGEYRISKNNSDTVVINSNKTFVDIYNLIVGKLTESMEDIMYICNAIGIDIHKSIKDNEYILNSTKKEVGV